MVQKNIYLLGSGHPDTNLDQRRIVANVLRKAPYNYEVYLMEDYPNPPSLSFTWSEKFTKVLKEKKPNLTCAIFPFKAKHNAVEWELGILACENCSFNNFHKKVSLILSDKTTLKDLSMYAQQYITNNTSKFTKWKDVPKIIDKIYKLKNSKS